MRPEPVHAVAPGTEKKPTRFIRAGGAARCAGNRFEVYVFRNFYAACMHFEDICAAFEIRQFHMDIV